MLYKDILDSKYNKLLPHFQQLFELVLHNQSHSGDLLLIDQNAAISRGPDEHRGGDKKYYYEIGHNKENWSESTNYDFIGEYVTDAKHIYTEYAAYYAEHSKIIDQRDRMDHELAFTMQFEMLIYLKIWEGETFAKKWYQICRLLTGEHYDWTFHIKKHDPKNPGKLSRDDVAM